MIKPVAVVYTRLVRGMTTVLKLRCTVADLAPFMIRKRPLEPLGQMAKVTKTVTYDQVETFRACVNPFPVPGIRDREPFRKPH